jgi:uncharacterized protein YbjQ (UPF0145 family)
MEHEGAYIILVFFFLAVILPIIIWTISIIGSHIILSRGRESLDKRTAITHQTHPHMLNNMRTLTKIPLSNSDSSSTFTPLSHGTIQQSGLVFVNSVYSLSKWSVALARLKSLVGGRIQSAEKMLELARQETIQRLREQAIQQGWTKVINVRVETLCLDSKGNRPSAFIEFCVYGTGIRC